jgi:hypothetical protein
MLITRIHSNRFKRIASPKAILKYPGYFKKFTNEPKNTLL